MNKTDMQKIHHGSLRILEKTGLKVLCRDFHGPLEAAGARIDTNNNIVRFPARLIEETMASLKSRIENGARQNILNGVVASKSSGKIQAKFGGACIQYLDWEKQEVREPNAGDLRDMLQLGEALEEVTIVGNPLCYIRDDSGNRIPPHMQRIMTASMVARNTGKCGSTEVWNEKELNFLVEIGVIVHGSLEAFKETPCFVTAKETITPLLFPEDDGKILLALARRGLPCTVIPMPLSGGTAPVTAAANLVIGNAEILGVMACICAAVPDAVVAGGAISGVIDMASGSASFSAPEAQKQDLMYAQLYEKMYGQDFAIGGYIDAKLPGAQSLAEISLKMWSLYHSGRVNYPLGLLAGGIRFSPEQALLSLEVARMIHRQNAVTEISDETMQLDLIEQVGISGNFLAEEHTARNFRREINIPEFFDRRLPGKLAHDTERDMINEANCKVRKILAESEPYRLSPEKEQAIDAVVKCAQRTLS